VRTRTDSFHRGEAPPPAREGSSPGMLRITWIGHSTVLVDLDGVRLLTDPVLRPRIAHLRRIANAVDTGKLGELDAVLVSHLHYDHFSIASLRLLGRSVRVVVPQGAARMLRRRGFSELVEVDVGDEVAIGAVTVRATEAEHPGKRSPWGRNAPSVGYLVSGSARVYFAGDTDLFDGMSELGPDIDLALLPVAGWGPRLPAGHLDPLSAATALALLRPRTAIPIHWGTYRPIGLGRAPSLLREPAEEFERHAHELAPDVDVRIVPVGGSVELQVPAAAGGRA
jgi:L-ascorbate metabolism protein UlaG (beta-lactamase superfamily)